MSWLINVPRTVMSSPWKEVTRLATVDAEFFSKSSLSFQVSYSCMSSSEEERDGTLVGEGKGG